MSVNPPRILIAAGGTAGHVVPALAVADALRAGGAQVEFAGGDRAEVTLVPAAGYTFHRVHVVQVPRHSVLAGARALTTDFKAVIRALSLVGRIAPDAVLGGGGYVSAPVGVAAAVRRVPLVLMEADGHLGISNRLLAPMARRVCTALPLPGHQGPKFKVTGRPVPAVPGDRQAARARFGVGRQETLVVLFGGSQGAGTINRAALDAFGDPASYPGVGLRVLHAAGERDLPELATPGAHYDLRGYVSEFMEALVAADLVIARSGGSVWEIAAAGRPAILVPYPHATQDHQSANARHFADAGSAVIIPDGELSAARLAAEARALLSEPERLTAMARAAAAAARPRAADEIAAEVLAAIGERG